MFCREWLAQLEQQRETLLEGGFGQIIGISMGEPKHAVRVCGRKAPHLTCLSDATTGTHDKYGLTQGGLSALVSPKVVLSAIRATLRGNFQGQATGDTKMLPGTFIVDTAGVIQYAYYSEHAGDHPDIDALIAAL